MRPSGIELVSLVSPVTFRHPAVFYKMAVTLDEISGGRFTLGIGVGWMTEEFTLFGIDYPDRSTRYEMLDECFAYIRAALDPTEGSFEGKHYQLGDFDPHPHPTNLRLLVGGGGPDQDATARRPLCGRVQHLRRSSRLLRDQGHQRS